MRTNVYVDGFNLYYGAVKGTPYKWLDVAATVQRVLPKIKINRIRYFTAIVNGAFDPDTPLRQQIYLRALRTIPNLSIHLGFFLTKTVRAQVANPPPNTIEIVRTDEKGSDVNLATYLLVDGFQKDYDQAIVVSNDSDLCEPIRVIRAALGLPVGVINPHTSRRPAAELKRVSLFFRQLHKTTVANSQFPSTMHDRDGTFSKPPTW
jgi:hypothetical protein